MIILAILTTSLLLGDGRIYILNLGVTDCCLRGTGAEGCGGLTETVQDVGQTLLRENHEHCNKQTNKQ